MKVASFKLLGLWSDFRALENVSSDSKHIMSVDFQVIRVVEGTFTLSALRSCCLCIL